MMAELEREKVRKITKRSNLNNNSGGLEICVDRNVVDKNQKRDKNKVMSLIPSFVKNEFQSIGFAKWKKFYLPVIQVSPYDVQLATVREQWMNMFEEVRFYFMFFAFSILFLRHV
jgi:hypothetical protein